MLGYLPNVQHPASPEENMIKGLKFTFLLAVLLSCVGCDQATKSAAKKLLATSDPIPLLNDLIIFEYTENPGAFLGAGAGLPSGLRFWLFTVLAGALMALMIWLILKNWSVDLAQITGLALVTGGGIGNLIDRIVNEGRVIDFVSIGIGTVRTGIFNVADMAIIAGVVLLTAGMGKNEEGTRGDV
jgi:signal peptidase II